MDSAAHRKTDAETRPASRSGMPPVYVAPAIAAMLTWSMVVNPLFEKTVRIQTDRGHRVIDTEPYAYARHPGYVAFIGWMVSTPLLLDSSWAFIPALVTIAGIVIRTILEKHTLRAELPGYPTYATRARFRLIPGVG